MQKVSDEYKQSMKSSLRNRAYIMLTFGLINQEIQSSAKIDIGSFTYYSNNSGVFSQKGDKIDYVTMEENFTKVDGSMYFPPQEESHRAFLNTSLVGKPLVSDGQYELTINLNTVAADFKGLTVNFGDNYPINFDIKGENGTTIEIRDNSSSEFRTEEVIGDTTYVKFIFYKMKNPQSRLRIYSITFGYGLVYYNDSVMDSTLETYISPICEDVPQIDFSVQLKNYDKYFNVDNPNSAINFLETGQEMNVSYGYELSDGSIEWVQGQHLLCSEWESDDYTATIKCQDIFRTMDTEYYRGVYNANGESFYNLAEAVLKEAGKTDYYIDSRLKSIYSKNPLPRVETKQALQIIANACRCILTQTRDGKISIKSNFVPGVGISSNGEESYSNITNVLNNDTKAEYGTFATNYVTVDGGMYFLPTNNLETLYTGYISKSISNASCTFMSNPIITLSLETAYSFYGLRLRFGNALPAKFIIRTYNADSLVNAYSITDISKSMMINLEFGEFNKLTIEFTKTSEPYNRIVLDYIALGDTTNFKIERRDMMSSPTAIKQESVKEVVVPYYIYQSGTELESVVEEDITVSSGDIVTYYIGDASYGYTASLEGVTSGVTITDSGCYFITVKYSVTGTYKINIQGYKYKIVEKNWTVKVNDRGKTIKWENPMLSDAYWAWQLAEWLADYYKSDIEYEYDTRGNPELDANDIVYQENDFHDNMKVNAYRVTLNFKQAFSGAITARRIEG
jgi:hypothetical protein